MRLIDADALSYNLDGMTAVSPTGYIHGDTVADMIGDAPTIEPEREWISCKPVNDNYLPDLKDKYMMILVTYRTGRGRVRKVKACLCNYGSIEKKVPGIITAYKPFPEPYMEEGEPDDKP